MQKTTGASLKEVGNKAKMTKVTAYCRVSTDSLDQKNSLANQEQFFCEYISTHDGWQYMPMYVDEGLSGTSTRRRDGFNKMMSDAHAGIFELILTKEVSRFSRNTMDTLKYTRELKEIGVGVIFINDNIDTRESTDEFRLTIMASCAQEEARKISERVKWGQKRSMENGVIFGQKTLGYRRISKDKLEIIPREAETVRKIFSEYIGGKGLNIIAQELEKDSTPTAYGKKTWDATAIMRILKNEKYCGDLVQKKFITTDFLTHKTKRNKGEEELVTLRDLLPAIIPRETFEQARAELTRRAKKSNTRYTNRYAFSGKLKCPLCDSVLVSRSTKKQKRWLCASAIKKECNAKMLPQKIIEAKFLKILATLCNDLQPYERITSDILQAILTTPIHTNEQKIKKIKSRLDYLIELRIDGEITKQELIEKRKVCDDQISALKNLPKQTSITDITAIKNRISDIISANVFSEEVAKELMDIVVITI
ncbi:MAG: recombinase family protein [Defluviitaleaceae bacterium]|nr:recombinase family protein [Defluviitaleaceae bacterium]